MSVKLATPAVSGRVMLVSLPAGSPSVSPVALIAIVPAPSTRVSTIVPVRSASTMPSAFTAPTRGTVVSGVARALTTLSGAGSSRKASCVAITSEVIAVAMTLGKSVRVPTVRSPSSSATIASVSPSAAGLWLRPLKVATPATAATSMSPSMAPALDSLRVTVSVKSVSTLPKASTAETTGWVVNTAPAVVPAGSVVKRRPVATT